MLILTRLPHETICIGDNATVTVLEVQGSQVRIGINAPAEVTVHREEIWMRIQQELTSASSDEPCHKHAIEDDHHD